MPLVCALSTLGCKSLDGLTGGSPSKDAGGGDAGQQPPCVPNVGLGTLCITVRVDPNATSPGYGAFSNANTVKADGTGYVQVFLFDKDPVDPANGHVLPTVTLRQPPTEGFEIPIDSLPQQLVGTAPAGDYFVFAMFADNQTDPRGTGLLSTLPGDLVTPQNISGASLFPKLTLEADKVQSYDLGVVPLRQVTLNCSASNALLTSASQNSSIHGDGPAGFFVYDGSLTAGAPAVVDFGQISCLDLELQNPARPLVTPALFGTTATGTHNVYGTIFDYETPPASGSVLTNGTVESSATSPPQLGIDVTQWAASLDFEFTDVIKPLAGSPTDPLHCN